MRVVNKIKDNVAGSLFFIAIISFVVCQLVVNSILAPLGTQLQSLNKEKNYLLEENRGMEEKIAKSNSITVIRKLSDKSLSLSASTNKTVIYLQEASIVANK